MITFGKHLRDIEFIHVGNFIIDTREELDYRAMAGDGKWVYSMEAILSQSYKMGWKGSKPGISAFADCYGEITKAYLEQKLKVSFVMNCQKLREVNFIQAHNRKIMRILRRKRDVK